MSKDTFYFSHDYNTRNDIKIKDLIVEHGMIGYGVFWSIIEDLYNNANALPLKYKTIAYDLRVDESIVKSIINDFDLFVFDNDIFGSLSVERRLDERALKSKKASKAAAARWEREKQKALAMQTHANALQSECDTNAIKERKGKEMKVNENILLEKETKKYTSLNFKNDLIDYGFKEDLVNDWLLVRKGKKLTNTKTAFNKFIKQVELNGSDKNLILEECVSRSWGGFESSWFNKQNIQQEVQQNINPQTGQPLKFGEYITESGEVKYKPPFAL